jgi:hypothetical protein
VHAEPVDHSELFTALPFEPEHCERLVGVSVVPGALFGRVVVVGLRGAIAPNALENAFAD